MLPNHTESARVGHWQPNDSLYFHGKGKIISSLIFFQFNKDHQQSQLLMNLITNIEKQNWSINQSTEPAQHSIQQSLILSVMFILSETRFDYLFFIKKGLQHSYTINENYLNKI